MNTLHEYVHQDIEYEENLMCTWLGIMAQKQSMASARHALRTSIATSGAAWSGLSMRWSKAPWST